MTEEQAEKTKPALASRGVRGGLIAIIGPVIVYALNLFGIEMMTEEVTGILMALASAVGGIYAAVGRINGGKAPTAIKGWIGG